MSLILYGIILGLGVSWSSVTVSASLFSVTIHYGKKRAYAFVSQMLASDIFMIILLRWGTHFFDLKPWVDSRVMSFAGLILCLFGVAKMLRKEVNENRNLKISLVEPIILNVINPLIWLYWLGILTLINSSQNPVIVGSTAFISFIISEIFKINLFNWKGQIATSSFNEYIDKGIGFLFLLSGVKLLFFMGK